MIRLEKFAPEGLRLENCGLLFLATPHSGSEEANWSDLSLLLAKMAGVARGQVFTQLLNISNQASVNAQEQFGALKPMPPLECLYETQKTSIAGTGKVVSIQSFLALSEPVAITKMEKEWGLWLICEKQIVSSASAGLINRAKPMWNVDHRTICKFPNTSFPGHLQVLDCLEDIRKRLVPPRAPSQDEQRHETRQDGEPIATTASAALKGGCAIGGNATSNVQGGKAEGGSATGGNIDVSTARFTGDMSLTGGEGQGGSGTGDYAVGGSAVGGDVRLG